MRNLNTTALLLTATLGILAGANASAAVVITEVSPSSSDNAPYAADWFELTNTGNSAVNITGWKMDDNSNSFNNSVALTGVSSIAAGQSVVFVEDTNASSDATLDSSFESTWFGANVPAGFTIGNYGGGGVGLSTGGDQVNIFDSSGTRQADVTFGAVQNVNGPTFDNSAGINGTLTTRSAVGVDGAFKASDGEIGSPGTIAPVPIPATAWLLGGGLLGLFGVGRRRRA
jgi:hypothetical protein